MNSLPDDILFPLVCAYPQIRGTCAELRARYPIEKMPKSWRVENISRFVRTIEDFVWMCSHGTRARELIAENYAEIECKISFPVLLYALERDIIPQSTFDANPATCIFETVEAYEWYENRGVENLHVKIKCMRFPVFMYIIGTANVHTYTIYLHSRDLDIWEYIHARIMIGFEYESCAKTLIATLDPHTFKDLHASHPHTFTYLTKVLCANELPRKCEFLASAFQLEPQVFGVTAEHLENVETAIFRAFMCVHVHYLIFYAATKKIRVNILRLEEYLRSVLFYTSATYLLNAFDVIIQIEDAFVGPVVRSLRELPEDAAQIEQIDNREAPIPEHDVRNN
jgi:hypothetical protein